MSNYVINTITLTGSDRDIAAICALLRNKNADSNEAVDFNNVIPMPNSMNLVCGDCDKWYVAAYIKSLPEDARMNIAQQLLKHKDIFYKSYYHKYMDAFTKDIPFDSLVRLQESYKKDYETINPSTMEEVGKVYIDNILKHGADTWYSWSCNNWGTKWNAVSSYFVGNCIGYQTAWSAALPVTAKLSEMFPDVIFSHEWADEDIGSNCGRYKYKAGKVLEEYLPKGEEAVLYACEIWGFEPYDYGVVC